MKTLKILLVFIFCTVARATFAQTISPDVPTDLMTAITKDDAVTLGKFVTKENVSDCYGLYTLLSHAVRFNAHKCFDLLLDRGADVNKICGDYIPPLMNAVEYGRLDMIKILIAKGADPKYQYKGARPNLQGMNPVAYAAKYKQAEVAAYLETIK